MRLAVATVGLSVILTLATSCSGSPMAMCRVMFPDGVSSETTVEMPSVCIRSPEPSTRVGVGLTVSGYAAGTDEVIVEMRGMDEEGSEVVLASLQVPVEGATQAPAGEFGVGIWQVHLPVLPPAGTQKRATVSAQVIDGESGRSVASAEIAIDLEEGS